MGDGKVRKWMEYMFVTLTVLKVLIISTMIILNRDISTYLFAMPIIYLLFALYLKEQKV